MILVLGAFLVLRLTSERFGGGAVAMGVVLFLALIYLSAMRSVASVRHSANSVWLSHRTLAMRQTSLSGRSFCASPWPPSTRRTRGAGQFTEPQTNVRHFATLYPAALQTVVRRRSDIQGYGDPGNRHLSPGKIGMSGTTIA